MSRRLHVVLPTLKPVGGIVKCFDYIGHARKLGFGVCVYCDQRPEDAPELFLRPDFAAIADGSVSFLPRAKLPASREDLYLFSLPSDFSVIEPLLRRGVSTGHIIHLVQNTRHADAGFENGYALRLLTRPMSRITINDEVLDAIRPYLHKGSYCGTIPLGHDSAYFHKPDRTNLPGGSNLPGRAGDASPLRVGYMIWKSDFGDRLAHELAGDDRYEFTSLRRTVGWPELREFYHSLDILLCTPMRKEGFYLPGLEAMAAGCVVIVPDVEGNMSYCRFGENCIGYGFEDISGAADALDLAASLDAPALDTLRARADATWRRRDLETEGRQFAAYLAGMTAR